MGGSGLFLSAVAISHETLNHTFGLSGTIMPTLAVALQASVGGLSYHLPSGTAVVLILKPSMCNAAALPVSVWMAPQPL